MAGFLARFGRQRRAKYNIWQLVDHSRRSTFDYAAPTTPPGPEQIICDIDKTYLETEFESIVKIARIAFFENADDKITVQGASEVLLAARWGAMDIEEEPAGSPIPRPLHFVSSSPPQLRKVLVEKLAMDGLDWTSDTFKNQVYNIRKGRFDLLRQQIAYKSAAILNIVDQAQTPVDYFMLGDNAESDALIYLGVKFFIEGLLSREGYSKFLQITGVEAHMAEDVLARFPQAPRGRVRGIFIRKLSRYPFHGAGPLSDCIVLFQDFLDVALLLSEMGVIAEDVLHSLRRVLHNRYGFPMGERSSLALTTPRNALTEEEILLHTKAWVGKTHEFS